MAVLRTLKFLQLQLHFTVDTIQTDQTSGDRSLTSERQQACYMQGRKLRECTFLAGFRTFYKIFNPMPLGAILCAGSVAPAATGLPEPINPYRTTRHVQKLFFRDGFGGKFDNFLWPDFAAGYGIDN